ncbi:ribosomal oxygenase 1-like [Lineus longissimus]|uniref:ribosomal oxygenase 1-like n=1 Tax=Lineus longissimus TaxID=88925 RepID=UPI002B4CD289
MVKSSKKVSAFAVFKNKKAYNVPQNDNGIPSASSSMTSLNSQFEEADKISLSSTLHSRRSGEMENVSLKSGRRSGERVSSLKEMFRGSIRKRQSSGEKKEKKAHRNSKGRPSFLPDEALKSPVIDPEVKLTGMKTRASSSKLNGLPPRPTSTTLPDYPKVQKIQSSSTLPVNTTADISSKTLRSSQSDISQQKTSTPYNSNASTALFTAKASKSPKLKSPKASDITTETKTPSGHLDLMSKENIVSSPKKGKTPDKTPKNTPGAKEKTPNMKSKKSKTPEMRVPERKQSTPKDQSSPDLPTKRPRQPTPREKKAELSAVSPSPKKRRVQKDTAPEKVMEETASNSSDVPDGASIGKADLMPLEKPSLTMYDSQLEAQRLFELMIHPVKLEKFFKDLWEQKPLIVKRHKADYNEGWFSTAEFDRIMRENALHFGVNLDIVTYENGRRETHNPPGRAYAPIVWDYYSNGCSVRLLNPQTFSPSVWKCLSVLQEYFGCFVGANIYLTPPGSQGFAPHYDDIEAFVIQLEGKKHWKLYNPMSENQTLPRFSSKNFSEEDLGAPLLDTELEAGDFLYFPRGIVHQANTPDDTHSLHITVSACQKNTWGDLLMNMVPAALKIAMEEDIDFRRSLPRDYQNYMGIVNSDKQCEGRASFLKTVEKLMKKLLTHSPVDAACDQMGQRVVHEALPPFLTEADKMCSIHGMGEKWDEEYGRVRGRIELEPDTCVKIVRKGVIRLVMEEETVRIYHSLENTRVFCEKEPQFIDVSSEVAPAVEFLIHQYPKYVPIDSLPLETIVEKIDIATQLYEKGLLLTYAPLEPLTEGEDDADA